MCVCVGGGEDMQGWLECICDETVGMLGMCFEYYYHDYYITWRTTERSLQRLN